MVEKIEWSEAVLSQIVGAPPYVGNGRAEPITQSGILEGIKQVDPLFSDEYYKAIEKHGFVVRDGKKPTPG